MSDFGEPLWMNKRRNPIRTIVNRQNHVIAQSFACERELIDQFERLHDCHNALAGISRPAEFVERAKALMVLHHRQRAVALTPTKITALAAEWTEEE